jgi:PurA ssDNA and RNA-binding protein
MPPQPGPAARSSLQKKPPIFLPFRRSGAVKSQASGKMDNIIEAKELQIERKHFYVEFRENERGKFLRITEEAHGRRNTIIVPSTGVGDFTAAISDVLSNGSTPL